MVRTFVVLCVSILLGGSAAAQQFDSQAERRFVELINQERERAGVPSLKVDERLVKAAREHSVRMAQAKTLSHQLGDEPRLSKRLAETGIRFNNSGENVAYDSDIDSAHSGLMNSPGHRENILNPRYNTVGVGVVRRGDVLWVTQNFANRLQEYSVDEAEQTIIAAWQRERRQARTRPAGVAHLPRLRQMACAMARRGELNTRSLLGLPDVNAAVAYTESDPAKLPSNAVKKAQDRNVRRIAVGACFADGPNYPVGVWWVCMVFY